MKAKVPQNMAHCFALIERTMFVGPFVRGDAYSVADPYLFTIAGWLESDGGRSGPVSANPRPSQPGWPTRRPSPRFWLKCSRNGNRPGSGGAESVKTGV